MEKKLLRFSILDLPPLYVNEARGNLSVPVGFIGVLLEFLVKMMDVRYETVHAGFGFGHYLGPGNYTGALGMVVKGEVDIMLALYPTAPDLFDYAGFSTAVDAMDCGVLSGPPIAISEHASSLLSSIGLKPLLILMVSWVLISVVFYLFKVESQVVGIETHENNSLNDILLSFYGLMFQRGFRNAAVLPGRRLVVSGWLFMSLVLMTVVAGTLYSQLAITAVPERLDRLEDLLKLPDVKPYLTKGVIVDSYLKASENKDQQKIWQRAVKMDGLQNMEHFFTDPPLDEVAEGKAVVISNKEAMLAAIASHACVTKRRPYHLSKTNFNSLTLVIVYRRGLDPEIVEKLCYSSIYYGSLNFVFLARVPALMSAMPCLDHGQPQAEETPLGIRELRQAFQLLMIGLALSVVVFCGEVVRFSNGEIPKTTFGFTRSSKRDGP